MKRERRKILGKMLEDYMNCTRAVYTYDDDQDLTLLLDDIMSWSIKAFGVGEILEYLSIYFVATGSDEDGVDVELNRISEKLKDIVDSIPELKS